MPKGQDHVNTAIALCQSAEQSLDGTIDAESEWKSATQTQLEDVAEALEGLKDRFFLRSKLCLPFAAKCARAASDVEKAVQALSASPDDAARQRLSEAIDALARAARALDERSAMQDMAIT